MYHIGPIIAVTLNRSTKKIQRYFNKFILYKKLLKLKI